MGIGFTTWQAIESGRNVPSGETLLKIAALGFNPGWILTGQGCMRTEDPGEMGGSEARVDPAGAGVDPELMGRVVDTIARVAKAGGASIPPIDLGRRAAEKYTELVAATANPDERLAMLKLLAVQLRAEFSANAISHEKGAP